MAGWLARLISPARRQSHDTPRKSWTSAKVGPHPNPQPLDAGTRAPAASVSHQSRNSKDALDIAVTPQQRESLDGAAEPGPQHSADLRSEHVESGRPTTAPAPTGRRRGDASSSDADAFAAPTPPLKRKPAQTPPGVRKKGVLWSDGVPSIRRSLKPSQLRSFRKPGPPVVARTLQAAIIEGSVERVETLLRSHPNALEWCECRHGHLHAAGAGRLHMLVRPIASNTQRPP